LPLRPGVSHSLDRRPATLIDKAYSEGMFSVPVIEFSPIYHSLFQGARRIASSRHPSCSFPPHESPSFLHASPSSYRPVWDCLSALATSWPSLLAPSSFLPSDHLAWA